MKLKPILFFLFSMLLMVSCQEAVKKQQNIASVSDQIEPMIWPRLTNFPQNGSVIQTDKQLNSYCKLFNTRLHLGEPLHFNDSLFNDLHNVLFIDDPFELNKIRKIQTEQYLKLYVDTAQSYDVKFRAHQMPMPHVYDSLTKTFKAQENKNPFYRVLEYPVFLYNFGDSSELIELHDGTVQVIQEALNPDGEWQAIEYFQFSRCGNSFNDVLLRSNELFVFGIHRFKGSFQTQFRLRMKTGNQTLFSNEFYGSVQLGQFNKAKLHYGFNCYLLND
jgi:hypothetical protein